MCFENKNLNTTLLFNKLIKFYNNLQLNIVQNQTLKLVYETFRRYLKNNFNFGFKPPRSGLHFKSENKGLNNLSNERISILL
jgi:hypothetical protein